MYYNHHIVSICVEIVMTALIVPVISAYPTGHIILIYLTGHTLLHAVVIKKARLTQTYETGGVTGHVFRVTICVLSTGIYIQYNTIQSNTIRNKHFFKSKPI